jgi:hypothetical protein
MLLVGLLNAVSKVKKVTSVVAVRNIFSKTGIWVRLQIGLAKNSSKN